MREGGRLPQQPALRGVVQTWLPRPAKSPLGESDTLGSSLYCGDVASPRAVQSSVSSSGASQASGSPSGLPQRILASPQSLGSRRARSGAGAGPRPAGAQRKGLVPACGAGCSGPAESKEGSSGGGRLAGGGVKAPARGKTLTEAGRVAAAGTLLRGRGREVL